MQIEMNKQRYTDRIAIRQALVSVSNKEGLASLVHGLEANPLPLTFYATGGTYRELRSLLGAGDGRLSLEAIEDYTRYPEMPGGLVKTLHPRIHGGLLADLGDAGQVQHMHEQGMVPFDLAILNLYPFERTIAQADTTLADARLQIDIGGPTMLRAAAKNFPRVAVVVDPADYGPLLRELADHDGTIAFETRWRLAQKAFRHVLDYDRAIADYVDGITPTAARQAFDVR